MFQVEILNTLRSQPYGKLDTHIYSFNKLFPVTDFQMQINLPKKIGYVLSYELKNKIKTRKITGVSYQVKIENFVHKITYPTFLR